MRFNIIFSIAALALAGCADLAAVLPQSNNTADTAALYIVQVCKLPADQRAAALAAMNSTVAPRVIALDCP